MTFVPNMAVSRLDGQVDSIALGHPVIDEYLVFIGARARPNTWLAIATDMKVFFRVVHKDPAEVTTADVFTFLAAQRVPRQGDNVVRLEDREFGLASRTIDRRLSTMRGLYAYLVARGDAGVAVNPVPGGLAVRRPRTGQAKRATPLIRTPRTLPRVLSPNEVDSLVAALRRHRDQAMVEAMVLGGLRRCEVLGLRFADIDAGQQLGCHEHKGVIMT